MSDWPTFVDGEEYTWAEIAEYTFPARGHRGDRDNVDPGTRFRYSKRPGAPCGVFDEIVEPSAYSLVSADEVQEALEQLFGRGLDVQAIAKAAGLAADSVHRAAAGNGVIRRSTRDAIRAAAANGKRATG